MTNRLFRISLGAACVLISGSLAFVACSEETINNNPAPDATAETGGPVDGGGKDTATADVVDSGPPDTAPPECPLIGGRDDQLSIGGVPCHDCVRRNCCDKITTAFAGADASTLNYVDGGTTEGFNRFLCWAENCIGVPDAGGCQNECDTQFSAGANTNTRSALTCLFGPNPGSPQSTTPANCGINPADASPLCKP